MKRLFMAVGAACLAGMLFAFPVTAMPTIELSMFDAPTSYSIESIPIQDQLFFAPGAHQCDATMFGFQVAAGSPMYERSTGFVACDLNQFSTAIVSAYAPNDPGRCSTS